MPVPPTRIMIFPASSYDDAHVIIGRLTQAGFPRAAMFVDRTDRDYEVALHTTEAGRTRAERAVHGSGRIGMLILAGAAAALGAALGALWLRSRSGPRGSFEPENANRSAPSVAPGQSGGGLPQTQLDSHGQRASGPAEDGGSGDQPHPAAGSFGHPRGGDAGDQRRRGDLQKRHPEAFDRQPPGRRGSR